MTYRIAVIGAGLMGHSFAQIFITGRHFVRVHDRLQEVLTTVKKRVKSNLTGIAEYRLIEGGDIATPDEAREMLGLKGSGAVNF